MEGKESFFKEFSKKTIQIILGALIALVPFYYNTNNRLDNIEDRLTEDKDKLNRLRELEIEPVKIYAKLEKIEADISKQHKAQEDLYKRQEKIYDMIFKLSQQ